MQKRIELSRMLHSIANNVYFQPPENVKMKYPCIVYQREPNRSEYADDKKYLDNMKFSITVIDKDPDSEIPDKVANLPYCSFDRVFVSDNLNHYVFTIFLRGVK